ncbi:hypothetical protein, partial [Hyphomicrobium sp.]|uniref:hypothetical protein n=1 Tax=Hyphomicrobium sp. TaxID=82 RepID=UPI0025C1ED1B
MTEPLTIRPAARRTIGVVIDDYIARAEGLVRRLPQALPGAEIRKFTAKAAVAASRACGTHSPTSAARLTPMAEW